MIPIEDHDFYHCIRLLLYVQKLAGGRIQRPKSEHVGKAKYYILNVYWISCNIITFGAMIRAFFLAKDGFSVETDNLFAYLIITFYISSGTTQITSYFSYRKIHSFLDFMIFTILRRFNHKCQKPMVLIHSMVASGISLLIAVTINS